MKAIKKIYLLLGVLPLLASCDNIDEAHRYIEEEAVEVKRNVLLEEFTGQNCPNCPDGHAVIESLEEQYGDQLIVVSIHAGHFGIPAPYGLMEPEGNDYANYWNVQAYPAAVVDRLMGPMGMADWSGAVRTEMGKETTLELSLSAQLSSDGSNIEVFTTLVNPTDMTGSLQLWVVENDIVAIQDYMGSYIPNYVHNNVFRACVNGVWGEEIGLTANEVKYVSNTVAIDSDWVIENVRIVGFYYNSGGVIQVERCGIGGSAV